MAGIENVANVTKTTIGNHNIYNIGSNFLVVEGTLEIAKDNKEQLIVIGDTANNITKITINNGGSIIVGDPSEENHEHGFNAGVAAIVTGGSTSDNPTGYYGNGVTGRRPSLSVQNGGSFQVYGRSVYFHTGVGCFSAGQIILKNANFRARDIYDYSSTSEYEDVRSNVGTPQLAEYKSLKGWFRENSADETYLGVYSTTPQITLDIENIPDGKYRYIGDWGSDNAKPIYNCYNALEGADYESGNTAARDTQKFIIRFFRRVNFRIKNQNAAAIGGAKIFLDGGTVAASQTTFLGHSITGITSATPNSFEYTTQSDGSTGTQEVSLGNNDLDGNKTITYSRTSTNNAFTAYFFAYGYLPSQTNLDLAGNDELAVGWTLFSDSNISQTDKSIVDAYTEIATLNQLYDRSSSWKVDNVADEHPAIDSPLITVAGATLDLGSQNLIVDANASQAFVVDTSTNTITLKANSLTVGNGDYTSIITTGSISTQNGGEILFGYEDSSGKNIFVDFNLGTSDTYHVKIIDLNNNLVIATHNDQTASYKGTFIAPSPFGSGAKVQLLKTDDNAVFYEANFTDENALTFLRTAGSLNDISTETTAAAQQEALFLARKILQKTESMAATLEGTTPTLADDTTTITEENSTIATKENQQAIRALLLRILTKTSASYEALKGAE